MSPNQGRRSASGKGGKKGASAKRAADPAALRRLAILIFAALFVVLFVVVAVAEGIGDPSIPDGDVAVIEDAPSGEGNISEKEFDKALKQSAAQSGKKETPKPGDPQYDELKEAALGSLLDAAWLKGEAAERGITVTKAEVEQRIQKLKKENFKTEAEYEKFLKESEFTQADVDSRVELTILSNEIQKQHHRRRLRRRARAKSKTITTPPSRPSSPSRKPATSASSSTKTRRKPNRPSRT